MDIYGFPVCDNSSLVKSYVTASKTTNQLKPGYIHSGTL